MVVGIVQGLTEIKLFYSLIYKLNIKNSPPEHSATVPGYSYPSIVLPSRQPWGAFALGYQHAGATLY